MGGGWGTGNGARVRECVCEGGLTGTRVGTLQSAFMLCSYAVGSTRALARRASARAGRRGRRPARVGASPNGRGPGSPPPPRSSQVCAGRHLHGARVAVELLEPARRRGGRGCDCCMRHACSTWAAGPSTLLSRLFSAPQAHAQPTAQARAPARRSARPRPGPGHTPLAAAPGSRPARLHRRAAPPGQVYEPPQPLCLVLVPLKAQRLERLLLLARQLPPRALRPLLGRPPGRADAGMRRARGVERARASRGAGRGALSATVLTCAAAKQVCAQFTQTPHPPGPHLASSRSSPSRQPTLQSP